MNRKWRFYLFIGLGCLLITGCKQKTPEETKPVAIEHESTGHEGMMGHEGMGDIDIPKIEKQVVVPEAVKTKWTSVSIAVTDKSSGKSVSYQVKPNSEFEIPNTHLKLKIGAFLPDFSMGGGEITSQSTEPNNPALQVTINERDVEKYSGWLFSKFSDVHAFEHEKYSIVLEDIKTGTSTDKI
jgi:hypothetical protein